MTISADAISTPRYILHFERKPLAPVVSKLLSIQDYHVIYGFSDKIHFDKFIANYQMPLTPYPLVKIHLKNVKESVGNGLNLIAINATGPEAVEVLAATNLEVLEAHIHHHDQVPASYRLKFDSETQAYHVEESLV
ncbi:hypothetical protein [uncultured Rubinisphaera sp.]|uniref:hypothetical protein n=1 Tax=uncultured Rubinisphaera sp. TaxID=1678686 RepID=UPI0030D92426